MSKSEIVMRLERELGQSGLVEMLAQRLSATDLQSLLLAVYQQRCARLTPGQVLDQYEQNRFVRPADSDASLTRRFDDLAARFLPDTWQWLELSPLAPLGSSAVPATVDQNKVVSTCRNTEVLADPTNVLALESALRRRALLQNDPKGASRVCLCTNQRVVRAQFFDAPGACTHFRLFAATTAGRDSGSHTFEFESLTEHLRFYLKLLSEFDRDTEKVLTPRIRITDLQDGRLTPFIQQQVLEPLRQASQDVVLEFDPDRTSGRNYYTSICFKIHWLRPDGTSLEIGDGGFTDWTQQFLSNRKERLLTSCLAPERVMSECAARRE